jgi:hypothetical protein
VEGVAYSLTHIAIKGSKAAPKGAARLNPLLGLESITYRLCDTLKGSMLLGLGI